MTLYYNRAARPSAESPAMPALSGRALYLTPHGVIGFPGRRARAGAWGESGKTKGLQRCKPFGASRF